MGSYNIENQSATPGEEKIVRLTAEFQPSVWGDYFLDYSLWPSTLEPKEVIRRRDELKREVKVMLKDDNDLLKTLSLIDNLQRLGLDYHFEEEIDDTLRHIQNDVHEDTDDLHVVALRFRLLRQQGYYVSSDVFNKFKNEEGMFKQELSSDAKGLLCLYEASWLGTCDEVVLDEAMKFARHHMELLMAHTNNGLVSSQIERALEMPFHRGMRRLEARHHLAMYLKEDKTRNHVLMELATLDFNLLQSLHQAEIKALSMWWREAGLVQKLSFARDRLVECYFWSLGVHFEPQNSQGRMLLAKMTALASVMDDMFDAYGTLEELQLFTNVIKRWDLQNVDQLPEYMIVYLNSFMSVVIEIELELIRKGRLHHKHYLVESIKALVGAYFEEAKWASKGYMPTLEEYLHTSVMSSVYPLFTCVSLVTMEEEVTEDVLDSMLCVPKIIEASSLIGRLMNDLVSTKFEQGRNHVSSSVQCYMNDHGVTERDACLKLSIIVEKAWKDMNEECLKSCSSQKHLYMIAMNYARMSEVTYKHEDGYTNPSGETKENISMLLVQSIQD